MSALDQPVEQDELSRFREMLNDYWSIVYERAVYAKEPNIADIKMDELYRGFGPNARRLCNLVLPEWLESTDESLRFTAFVLIRKFLITSAIPELKQFIETHGNPENAPERFELKKAEQILELCMAVDSTDMGNQEQVGD